MGTPVARRQFATFLSHAHADAERVDELYRWLTEIADFPVWYDKKQMPASSPIGSGLAEGIHQCRSILILLTKASVASNWVREELEAGLIERGDDRAFRIIPVFWEDCEVPIALRSTSAIDARHCAFDAETALDLVKALYGRSFGVPGDGRSDVYVAAGWRDSEEELIRTVIAPIIANGFRPIGDSKDQAGFSAGQRVRSIMQSCGAMVAILPHREAGLTSHYILEEIAIAHVLGLPIFAFRDPDVDVDTSLELTRRKSRIADLDLGCFADLEIHALTPAFVAEVLPRIHEEIRERFEPPARRHYVFYSHRIKEIDPKLLDAARRVISGVTCMACEDGDKILEKNVAQIILERIRGCFLQIADVTEDNINSCIEAGMGYGAGVNIHLVARGARTGSDRPFMFRNEQVWHYQSDAEIIGLLHRLVRPYRRRVISLEIAE